jgi:hypothetical protein
MENWAAELLEILQKEEALLNSILNKAVLKTDALKTGNVNGIDAIVNHEQPLVLQVQAAENKRLALLKKFKLEEFPLSELAVMAGEDYEGCFTQLLSSMNDICENLKKRNGLNSELTKARLEFYNFLKGSETLYENDGRKKQSSSKLGLMDKKM